MSIYVFLGPSLPVDDARRLLDATYLPPVAMGDIWALMHRRPAAFVIIDGFFEQRPAVWHKEILYALSQGVPVYGSSSMGALRAAELHAFGMIGVGEIFEAFRDGRLEDDDEVAVTHGPAESGYPQLSEAMVNIRATLRRAEDSGVVDARSHGALIDIAKALFYPQRSWPAVLAAAADRNLECSEPLRAFVKRERVDAKRLDAELVLRRVAAGIAPHRPTFDFEPTVFWDRLTTSVAIGDVATRADDPTRSPDAIRRHVRALGTNRGDALRAALLQVLVAREANRHRLVVSDDELQGAADRFRRMRGLLAADTAHAWMRDNRMTTADVTELVRLEALTEKLVTRYSSDVNQRLLAALACDGSLPEHIRAVTEKWQTLERLGIHNPTLADAGLDHDGLVRWYEERVGRERFGLQMDRGSMRLVMAELLAAYIAEQHRDVAAAVDDELDEASYPAWRDAIMKHAGGGPALRAYPDRPRWSLPAPQPRADAMALDRALQTRRSAAELDAALPDADTLGHMLAQAHGITGEDARGPVPSSGGLQALDLYVVAWGAGWLPPGWYHYDRREHALAQLQAGATHERATACVPSLAPFRGALLFVIAADHARLAARYTRRASRFAALEAGHLMQNLCLLATAAGLSVVPLGGSFEPAIARELRLPATDRVIATGVLG